MKIRSTFLLFISLLFIIKPVTAAEKTDPALSGPDAKTITVFMELIELELADFSALMTAGANSTEPGKLRESVRKYMEESKASVIETVMVRTRDAFRAVAASVDEIRYPKDYDESGAGRFEVRDLGLSAKIDPGISENNAIILGLSVEYCEKTGDTDYGNNAKGVRMIQPRFHKARLETSVLLESGIPTLAGTMRLHQSRYGRKDPVIMVFIHATINVKHEKSEAAAE